MTMANELSLQETRYLTHKIHRMKWNICLCLNSVSIHKTLEHFILSSLLLMILNNVNTTNLGINQIYVLLIYDTQQYLLHGFS
jgi:hypothetical protein